MSGYTLRFHAMSARISNYLMDDSCAHCKTVSLTQDGEGICAVWAEQ